MLIGEPHTQRSYACNCLNIRLRSAQIDDQYPDLPTSPDYTPVYVERDEDIKIVFPHLTLRNRKRAPYIPDPAKTARYTSLTCLCCQTLVYRIHHVVSVHDEQNLKEGPIITKGWTETEVLRSTSGWVEVFHSRVLTEEGIQKQESSSQFSQTFGLVITPSLQSASSETVSGRSLVPEALPKYKLPPISPIFPEPKSKTSLFATLATLASRKSSDLRSAAEQYIDDIVKQKVEEIRFAENQLKQDVQSLLTKYNEGIKREEQERNSLSEQNSALRQRKTPSPSRTETAPLSGKSASVVRDFVPSVLPRVRAQSTNSPAPRVSSLSASLATSSFHHPRDQHHSPPRSPGQAPQSPISLQSASSATLFMQPATYEAGNVHRWGRNTDEQLDIATSYNYFLNLEEEMERRKQALAGVNTSLGQPPQGPGTSSNPEGVRNDAKRKEVESLEIEQTEQSNSKPAVPSPKSKGKRKVTFDVKVNQPEAVIRTPSDRDEMLFDFEDENERRGNGTPQPVLPLIEQPSRHPKAQRRNSKELSGLLSSLRPSSLPTPSYLSDNPTNSLPPNVDDDAKPSSDERQVEDQLDLPPPQTLPIPKPVRNDNSAAESSRSPREEEVLTKLAASMPSHRAAWRNNRGEFASFFSEKSDDWIGNDLEETTGTETMDGVREDMRQDGFVGSLPVPFHRPNTKAQRPPLSLASYQADGLLSTNHTVNGRRASAVIPLDTTEEHPSSEDGTRSDSTPTRDGPRYLQRRASPLTRT
ncbi:hypothetical protein E1B28_004745 [Marasmius oreades]|uniref:Uncharacterized protein n=1 Tax=Marasmius oreades TaxID=181124 RepID=A0A9P8ADJ9_9AGAR|nr:uncharacterized protein E1B28_004745 [Marasmius oreades]KAG7097395.1 hypothetical protein E1B28_004745 [Marasmius oreades]